MLFNKLEISLLVTGYLMLIVDASPLTFAFVPVFFPYILAYFIWLNHRALFGWDMYCVHWSNTINGQEGHGSPLKAHKAQAEVDWGNKNCRYIHHWVKKHEQRAETRTKYH